MKLRKRSYYFLLIVVYIVMSARSCNDIDEFDQSEFHAQASIIETGMQSDTPELQSLLAFEEKAKQKLTDFSEYISIIMDNGIDSTLREKVAEQIQQLFINDQVNIEFSRESKSANQFYSLTELINHVSGSDFNQISFSAESIYISQHLMPMDPQNYQGKINFKQGIYSKLNRGNQESEQQFQMVDFYLKKIEKKFGSDSKFVWQVFLGDISYLD